MKKIIDNLKDVCENYSMERKLKYIFRGAGGVGKTTTMCTIAYISRKIGCLIFYINAKIFTNGTKWINDIVSLFMSCWLAYNRNVELLKKIPSLSTQFRTLYNLACEVAYRDNSKSVETFISLINELLNITFIPVVFCIDQYNASLVDHPIILERGRTAKTVSSLNNPIGRILSNFNN